MNMNELLEERGVFGLFGYSFFILLLSLLNYKSNFLNKTT